MQKPPIFIVGVPRSGTTLLAALLAAHSNLSCGPETHFFRRLAPLGDQSLLINTASWPKPAIEFLASIRQRNFSEPEPPRMIDKYGISEQEIQEFLQHTNPGIAAILSSITELFMIKAGKKRWVEKTPDHIAYLEMIRKYFPDSPIIRIIRDPRDVVLSLAKVPWGVRSVLDGILYFRELQTSSKQFFETDTNSYTVYYETLVSEPAAELSRICGYIGEEFEPTMLDTSISGKSVNERNVPWKEKASTPPDRSRIGVWKSELSEEDTLLFEAFLGDFIQTHQYLISTNSYTHLGTFFPDQKNLDRYKDQIIWLAKKRTRFWKMNDSEKPSVHIYLGDPVLDGWLGNSISQKITNTYRFYSTFAQSKIEQNSVVWLPGIESNAWTGFLANLIKKTLSAYRPAITS